MKLDNLMTFGVGAIIALLIAINVNLIEIRREAVAIRKAVEAQARPAPRLTLAVEPMGDDAGLMPWLPVTRAEVAP